MNHDILEPEIWGFTNFYKKISDGSEFSIFGWNVMRSLGISYASLRTAKILFFGIPFLESLRYNGNPMYRKNL